MSLFEQCAGCKFWIEDPDSKEKHGIRTGRCKRMPPTLTGDSSVGSWPIVVFNDWCGEYKPKT